MKLASCLTLSMLLLFACKSEQSTEATKQTKITRIGESAPRSDSVVSGGTKAPESPTAATGKADATESSSAAGDRMRSKSGLTVSGRITNPDGSPSSDVLVQLIMLGGHSSSGIWGSSPDPGSSARSDKNGRYEIATTNTAFMFLQAEKAGAARVLVNIFDEKSQFRPDRNQTRRVVKDFSMSPAVQISGKIIDESGAPVTSASIVAVPDVFSNEARFRAASTIPGMTTATVAADGTFTLQELLAEAYILTVENSEYVPTMQSAQAPAENVTITMSREGSVVEGTVIRNNEGLPGANVSLVSVPRQRRSPTAGLMMTPRECKSGEGGTFRFARLPAGQYVLQSEKDGARSLAGISLELAARETTSGIILTLSAGHTITGIVTDHQTGEPIEGVTVSNQSLPMYFGSGAKEEARRKPEAQTDAQGRYRLDHQFGSTAQLGVEKKGYKVFRDNRNNQWNPQVVLRPDQFEIEKNIQMTATVSVSGVVKLENGRNAVGAQVTPFQRNDYERKPTVTDSSGKYEVEVMPYSRISLKAALDNFPPTYSDLIEVEDQSLTAPDIILQAGSSIAGTVVGPDDQPVPDAQVSSYVTIPMGAGYANSDNLGNVVSDASGSFLIPNVPQGQMQLFAAKKGYARSKPEQINVSSREPKTGVKLKLSAALAISGRIADEKSEPIQQANVNCWNRSGGGSGQASTDAQGKYRIEDLAEGVYEVQVYANGFDNLTTAGITAGSENVDFVMTKSARVLSAGQPRGEPPSGVFIGKVIDWSTRQPVTNFKVEVEGYSGYHRLVTDASNGRFTIDIQPRFNFQLNITAPGYMPLNKPDLFLQSSTQPAEQEFVMGPGGTVSGRVVAQNSKQPLDGVRVQLLGIGNEWSIRDKSPEKVVRTGPDGTFSIEKVTVGTNWLQFRPSPPLTSARRSIDIEHGKASDLGDIEIGEGAVIEGKLIRVPGDVPVPDAEIEFSNYQWGESKRIRTDEKGEFRQAGLLPGQYSIQVREHNIRASQEIEEGKTVQITLKIGSRVLNGLVTKRGNPVSGVQVMLNLEGKNAEKTTQTDADGKFTVEGLADALWRISVIPPSAGANAPQYYWGLTQYEAVEMSGGEISKHIELYSGRILGSVVDSDGKPVGEATLKLTPPKNASVSYYDMRTGVDGAFTYDYLPPGEYMLTATRNDGSRASQSVSVPAHSDVNNVVLRLEKTDSSKVGTLVSTALLMDGKPMTWAWCNLDRNGVRFEHSANRDSSGRVTITDIPEGVYVVDVSYWTYSSSQREVEIKAGETVTIDDVLYRAGALRWTIQDANGIPLVGIPCTLTPIDPNSIEKVRSDKTDPQGQFVTRGLFGGDYTGTAALSDGKTLTAKITIIAGELTVLTSKAE